MDARYNKKSKVWKTNNCIAWKDVRAETESSSRDVLDYRLSHRWRDVFIYSHSSTSYKLLPEPATSTTVEGGLNNRLKYPFCSSYRWTLWQNRPKKSVLSALTIIAKSIRFNSHLNRKTTAVPRVKSRSKWLNFRDRQSKHSPHKGGTRDYNNSQFLTSQSLDWNYYIPSSKS